MRWTRVLWVAAVGVMWVGEAAGECAVEARGAALHAEVRLQAETGVRSGVWVDRPWERPLAVGERVRLVVRANQDVYVSLWMAPGVAPVVAPRKVWPATARFVPREVSWVVPDEGAALVVDAEDVERGWALFFSRSLRARDPRRPRVKVRATVDADEQSRLCLVQPFVDDEAVGWLWGARR